MGDMQKEKGDFCVLADLLIPGKGEPIKNGCLIIEDKQIIYAGDAESVKTTCSNLPKTRVAVVMPGMWDCHVHILGVHKPSPDGFLQTSVRQPHIGARCTRDAMLLLDAGFTSVRDMGGFGLQINDAIEEGSIVGPRIYSANHVLSPTAGHADIHHVPPLWFNDACERGLPMITADGVAECLKATRLQLRVGANIIKICASGGVLSEIDNPVDQQFCHEEIEAIVQEAARAQRIVGAHCHGKAGILAALRAGVKTIEHGSYLDDECAELMNQKGAILVSTRQIVENGSKDFFPPFAQKKMDEVATAHWQSMKTAIRWKVHMATGTDTAGSIPGDKFITFSSVGKELGHLVRAGMSPIQAIQCATYNAPFTLGPQAPKSGLLAEGYDADLIALEKNPLDDIAVLSHPENVTHVWKRGKCFKSPGHPVSIL